MGGGRGCGVVIEGAKRALQADRRITALYLVGNRSEIHAALPQRGFRVTSLLPVLAGGAAGPRGSAGGGAPGSGSDSFIFAPPLATTNAYMAWSFLSR